MGVSKAAAKGRERQLTILVVDDDREQRMLVAELLEGRGYAVVLACDGQEAIEVLQEGLHPDLIVLDLTMPRVDGRTFLRHLRGTHSSTPVLITTAVVTEIPPGADACLEKPVEPSQFRALVARLSS